MQYQRSSISDARAAPLIQAEQHDAGQLRAASSGSVQRRLGLLRTKWKAKLSCSCIGYTRGRMKLPRKSNAYLLLILCLLGVRPEGLLAHAMLPQARGHEQRKGDCHDGHDAGAVQHRHHHDAAVVPRVPQHTVCDNAVTHLMIWIAVTLHVPVSAVMVSRVQYSSQGRQESLSPCCHDVNMIVTSTSPCMKACARWPQG